MDIPEDFEERKKSYTKVLKQMISLVEKDKININIPYPYTKIRRIGWTHFHLSPELVISLSGKSLISIPGVTIETKPNSLTLIPRGLPHKEASADFVEPFLHLVLMSHYQEHGTFSLHYGLQEKPESDFLVESSIDFFQSDDKEKISRYLDDLAGLYHQKDKDNKMIIKHLFIVVLNLIINSLNKRNIDDSKTSSKIINCKNIILRRLCEPSLNVKNLASEIGCAADYLSNIFKKETGIKLKDYINSQRIEYAKDLLNNSSFNVSEIAWTVGYSDENYFFRVFRKFEKTTPNAFRNKK